MLCENCGKNNATTHIKRVIGGVANEKHLCSACAAKMGYNGIGNKGIANMLASMFGDTSSHKTISAKKCERCGYAFSDIVQSGKMGCEDCYTTFYNELLPYLKRVHGNVVHMGKIPNNAPLAVVNTKSEIELLRAELGELIKTEEFEKAAQVRDRIRELEKEETGNE